MICTICAAAASHELDAKLASVGELKERKREVLGMVEDDNELDDGVAILISLLAERFLTSPTTQGDIFG